MLGGRHSPCSPAAALILPQAASKYSATMTPVLRILFFVGTINPPWCSTTSTSLATNSRLWQQGDIYIYNSIVKSQRKIPHNFLKRGCLNRWKAPCHMSSCTPWPARCLATRHQSPRPCNPCAALRSSGLSHSHLRLLHAAWHLIVVSSLGGTKRRATPRTKGPLNNMISKESRTLGGWLGIPENFLNSISRLNPVEIVPYNASCLFQRRLGACFSRPGIRCTKVFNKLCSFRFRKPCMAGDAMPVNPENVFTAFVAVFGILPN